MSVSGTLSISVTDAVGYIGCCIVKHLQNDHPEWTVTTLDNFYLGAFD